jgi:hypothetical protein
MHSVSAAEIGLSVMGAWLTSAGPRRYGLVLQV